MAPKTEFSHASFSKVLLRSAALAIALLVSAAPAHAKVITLVCQPDSGDSFSLQIDYDRKLVDLLSSNGSSWGPAGPAPATVTAGDVRWDNRSEREEVLQGYYGHYRFAGLVNRLSGEAEYTYWRNTEGRDDAVIQAQSGSCHEATTKF